MNRQILEVCAIRRKDAFDRLEFRPGAVWLTFEELSERFPGLRQRELETMVDEGYLTVKKHERRGLQFNTSPQGVVYLNELLREERQDA